MGVDVVGSVLRIVFKNKDRRVVPVGTVGDRFHNPAYREIVIRNHGRKCWEPGRVPAV